MPEQQTSTTARPFGLSEDDFEYYEERGRWLLKRLLFAYCGFPVAVVALGVLMGRADRVLIVAIQALVVVAFGLLFYRGSQLGRWLCIVMSTLSAVGSILAASQMDPGEGAFLLPFALLYLAFACVIAFSKSIRVFFHAQRERSMNAEW